MTRQPPPLYATDDEIARALFGEDREMRRHWCETLALLEREGFPPKLATMRGRRYWPAVRAWLDAREGLGTPRPRPAPGQENWNVPPPRKSTARA